MISYPKLFLRIKAILWDSVILGLFFLSMIFLSSGLEFSNKILQGIFVFLPVISLEPLLVYFTGSSLGHRMAGIKIIHKNESKSLTLIQCYLRFLLKSLLGFLSLLIFFFTKKYQAIHDYASKSVVVFIDESKVPISHKLVDQKNIYQEVKPALQRRFVVSFVYFIFLILIVSIISNTSVSLFCIEYDQCTAKENNILNYLGLGFIFISLLIFMLGFFCKLPGAYYKPAKIRATKNNSL